MAVTDSRHIKKPEEIQKVKPVVKPQKQFSNITFDEFDKIFSNESKLTKLEKKRLWEEEYEGKYVSWTGKSSDCLFSMLCYADCRNSI